MLQAVVAPDASKAIARWQGGGPQVGRAWKRPPWFVGRYAASTLAADGDG